jgi:GntR family transcriptional repressor for pyruvate dehydrogenase complex
MAGSFEFELRRDLLYEQVADQVQQMVVDEALRPGDRLPSERELSEQIGVSRSVIREAMNVLKVRGLIEARPGSGTYIRQLEVADLSAPMGLMLSIRQMPDRFRNLLEVRCTLEVAIAGLAAQRATGEDIARMEAAIVEVARQSDDAEQFTRADLAFHAALAEATHNELYSVLLAPIADLSFEFRMATHHYDAQATIDGALVHHRRILEQVKARDPQGARQAMRDHLDQAEGLMTETHAHTQGFK